MLMDMKRWQAGGGIILTAVIAASAFLGMPQARTEAPGNTPPPAPESKVEAPKAQAQLPARSVGGGNLPAKATASKKTTSTAGLPLNRAVAAARATAGKRKVYWALATPNDPQGTRWHTTKISAPAAWDVTTGSEDTKVAVIDTGFALAHEDLANRWAQNAAELGATASEGAAPNCTSRGMILDKSCNNLDDDDNGYVDDWRGWNFVQGDNNPQAGRTDPGSFYASHGTMVAGLVGATGNNGVGTAAVNWRTKILPLQVLEDSGVGYSDTIAAAIRYAIAQSVDVINLSLGSDQSDFYLEDAIRAASAAGIPVVAASGNGGCACVLYPAAYPSVIAVGATDINDKVASFSATGPAVDVVAPGTSGIYTTSWSATNSTSLYTDGASGTSLASPIVAGTVAMMKARYQYSDPRVYEGELRRTADKTTAMNGAERTDAYGYGRLNVLNAVLSFSAEVTPTYRREYSTTGDMYLAGSAAERDAAVAGTNNPSPYQTSGVKDFSVFRRIAR